MATIKRQRADGTWEYIGLTGEDIGALRSEFDSQKQSVDAH